METRYGLVHAFAHNGVLANRDNLEQVLADMSATEIQARVDAGQLSAEKIPAKAAETVATLEREAAQHAADAPAHPAEATPAAATTPRKGATRAARD